MSTTVTISTPLRESDLHSLRIGDRVLIRGTVYTARDAAHRRFIGLIAAGKKLPIDLDGQIIYYTGPAPARPGEVIGPAGPTTSGRLDPYTVPLLEAGLKGMIGKGNRGPEIIEAIKKHSAVYFAATGGAAVLLSRQIRKAVVAAYGDLGPEAVLRLEVIDFPVIVAVDTSGRNLYREGPEAYRNL
ncbi:MAG: Fe-S-containing hydro-lyase [PVC group bacterium]